MNLPDKATADLIRELKQGLNVEENFHQLFNRYCAQLRRFFQRKGFSPEDSRELTQEVFLSVFKGVKDFRQEAPFENWLFSIAENIQASEWERRKAKKRAAPLASLDEEDASETGDRPPLAALLADPAADPLTTVLAEEKLTKLREVVQQLPEQMRRCTQLRVVNDLPYREIAALLGISINTVKAHLHQAQKILREKLAPYFGEIDF